jgi:hypothetical protein
MEPKCSKHYGLVLSDSHSSARYQQQRLFKNWTNWENDYVRWISKDGKEVVMAYFRALTQDLPEMFEGNCDKHWSDIGAKILTGTYKIQPVW